jgi:site-specific DNA-methyltransferase (adenine-specific)
VIPYYEQDGITIYHGDCREILPALARPAVVVADPPYGVAMVRGDSKVRRAVAGDAEPFDPAHLLALCVPLVLFGANAYADKLPASVGWLVWDKTFPEMAHHSQCELAWTNYVKGVRIHREAYHGFMRQRDGWFHPTQKPVELFQWILNLRWTPPGLVVDPYMGSGPALIAAKNLARPAIGIEVDERYCEITARRLSQTALDFGGAA